MPLHNGFKKRSQISIRSRKMHDITEKTSARSSRQRYTNIVKKIDFSVPSQDFLIKLENIANALTQNQELYFLQAYTVVTR